MVARIAKLKEHMAIKQRCKFEMFHAKNEGNRETLQHNSIVIIFSSQTLAPSTTSVLAKGLNYAITPCNIPMTEIICGVELALGEIPLAEAEEISGEVCCVL